MHKEAYDWIAKQVRCLPLRRSVLEFGSKNVNGTIRNLFTNADKYLGVDIVEGAGVDVVSDAGKFKSDERFDTIVCTEMLEHTNRGRDICLNAFNHLAKGGVFLATMAGEGREPHSAVDGGELHEGEYYQNVTVAELQFWLSDFSFVMIDKDTPRDLYALAIKL